MKEHVIKRIKHKIKIYKFTYISDPENSLENNFICNKELQSSARNPRKFCTKIDPTIYNFAKRVKRNFGINASERCFRTEGEDWKFGYV